MRRLAFIFAIALLAACDAAADPAAEPGAAVAIGDTGAPLPGGFTLYPGAQELSRTSASQNKVSYTLLSLQSEAAPEAMTAFYREQAEAAGIAISLEVSANGLHQIGGEAPSGLNFSFTAGGADRQTSATLAIGQAARESAQ